MVDPLHREADVTTFPPSFIASRWSRARIALVVATSIVFPAPSSAQRNAAAPSIAPAPTPWTGWARCDIDVGGAGYNDRQTHLWMLSGVAPTVQGAMRIYPATWSVVGQGSLTRSNGRQSLAADWTKSVPGESALIAVIVRASDGRMLIKPWHAQLRVRDAVTVTQQLTIDGVAQKPSAIGVEAFEWSFPTVEDSAGAVQTNGTSSPLVAGPVGPMQPAGARGTSSCSWQFDRSTRTIAARVARMPGAPPSFPPIQRQPPVSPIMSFTQALADIDAVLVDAHQAIVDNVAQLLKQILSATPPPSPAVCATLAADADRAYSDLMASLQMQYARLQPYATTAAEQAAMDKQLATELASLKNSRDMAIKSLMKVCA